MREQMKYIAFGEAKTLSGWIEDDRCLCKNRDALARRINQSKWIIEEALSTPIFIFNPTGPNNKCWRGYGEISLKFFNRIKRRALRDNLAFDVTIEQIWDLFLQQNRLCSFSGVMLRFQSRVHCPDGTASLDRIDSRSGYYLNNVQWVHKDINMLKRNVPNDKFLYLCNKISTYQKKKRIPIEVETIVNEQLELVL